MEYCRRKYLVKRNTILPHELKIVSERPIHTASIPFAAVISILP